MPHPLEQRIAELQRHARRLLAWYGLGWFVACLLGAVLVLGLVDYLIRFQDRGIRIMCSLAVLLVAARSFWHFVYLPLHRRLGAVEIAQRVERRFPQLRERLSSSIEFLRRPDADVNAGSATLRWAVIQSAESEVAEMNLGESLDRRPTRRAVATALAVGILAGLILAIAPASSSMALTRLLKPLGDEVWPRQNDLAFVDPPRRLAVGQTFEVELTDRNPRNLPDQVRIHYRYENEGGPTEEVETMHLFKGLMVARKENISRPFSYRAEGGDDQSMEWIALLVVEPPRVESFKVKLTPPAYTGWPAEFSDRQIQALAGTRLEFNGGATKRLKTVVWKQEGAGTSAGNVGEDGISFRVPDSTDHPLVVEKSGAYWFELTDGEGLVGGKTDRWELRSIADQPPSVAIEHPAGNLYVTASAQLPLKVVIKDDLAIHDAALHYSRSDQTDAEDVSVALFEGPPQVEPAASPAVTAGNQSGDSRVIDYAWSLAPLKLKPGTQVTFFSTAGDYLPQQGHSPPRKLTIITEQELEDRLAQRQTLILGELGRALKLQQETRAQTTALEIQLHDVGQLQKQDIDHAQGAELNQRQVTRTLTSDSEGVPSQIKDLLADLESNRVDSPDLKRRMQGLLDEIDRLNDEHLGLIEREMTSAIKGAQTANAAKQDKKPPQAEAKQPNGKQPTGKPSEEKPSAEKQPEGKPSEGKQPADPVAQSLASAGEHQDQVIQSLETMVGELSQWDNYRRFAREIAGLRVGQEDVLKGTQQTGAKTLSKDFKDLEPQQQADLKKLANRQHDLARQFDKLQQQMEEAHERLKDEDPLAAETIGDALAQARGASLSGRMRQAGDQAQRNQVGQAIVEQQQIGQDLDELLNILSNKREQELGRLVKKLREAERDLQTLSKKQEGLRKKMAAAAADAKAGKADPAEHKRQLERLSREQRKLQEEAQRMARRLERLQAEQAGRKLGGAAGRMGQAGQAGEKGDAGQAGEQAEEAKKDLDEAQAELAKRRKQAEADLAQEQLARIEDTVKSLLERQGNVIAETVRLEQLREAKGHLTRGEAASLQELARNQKGLQGESHLLAEKISAAEVFRLALNNAGAEMQRAAELLTSRDTGVKTQQTEQAAQRRLSRLLSALKSDKKSGPRKAGGGGEGGGQGKGGQGGIRSIAELKLLKLMQEDLNDRLGAATDPAGGEPNANDPTAASAATARLELLTRLSIEQGQLADLALKMSQPTEIDPASDPEKLPDVRRVDQTPGSEESLRDLLPRGAKPGDVQPRATQEKSDD